MAQPTAPESAPAKAGDVLARVVEVVSQVTGYPAEVLEPEMDLLQALRLQRELAMRRLPVVENGKFLGLVSRATVLDHYRRELIAQSQST